MSETAFPMVSVVVPTYNQGHYLPIALDSVLFQDYPNLEVIISNFGSTDNTSGIIRDYLRDVAEEETSWLERMDESSGEPEFVRCREHRFPQGRQFKVLDSKVNIGGTAAYNEGFKQATGKYCMYLVGDDYLLPEAVSAMVEVLERDKVDVVYTDMFVVDDQHRVMKMLKKPDYSFEACLAEWFHLGVCRLYRTELHQRFGYYDETFRNANDYDMFLRLAMEGCSFKRVPRVLYCTRIHDMNGENEPANWRNNGFQNLLTESAECARRARAFIGRK